MNQVILLYEKTGACGMALLLLALVSLYLFFKNSFYLRWAHRDFKLFFRQVENGDIPIIRQYCSQLNNHHTSYNFPPL